MSLKSFEEICSKAYYAFANMETKANGDKWWSILEVEKSYAPKQREFLKGESKDWITDKSTSSFCPRTSPAPDLPHFLCQLETKKLKC